MGKNKWSGYSNAFLQKVVNFNWFWGLNILGLIIGKTRCISWLKSTYDYGYNNIVELWPGLPSADVGKDNLLYNSLSTDAPFRFFEVLGLTLHKLLRFLSPPSCSQVIGEMLKKAVKILNSYSWHPIQGSHSSSYRLMLKNVLSLALEVMQCV